MSAMEALLDAEGIEYRPVDGNQSILCPFHEDRTKSATVNLGEGLFFCFACGAGGDVTTLLIEERGMTYAAARQRTEELAGGSDGAVSRGSASDPGGSFLPRRTGTGPGAGKYRSPWSGGDP